MGLAWMLVAGGWGVVATAVQEGGGVPVVDPERAKLFSIPQMADLDILVGAWKVAETYFDEKGTAREGRAGTEEIVWMLDHHALYRRYNTATGDRVYRAVGVIAWSAPEKQYRGNWFDNAPEQGPSPRTITGSFDSRTATLTWMMESQAPDGSPRTHRVIERFVSHEERVATTFELKGDRVIKLMEVRYTRAEPCPASRGTVIIGG
jgi:hypothetical protein